MDNDTAVILEKLEHQENMFNNFNHRLTGIEQAVTDLAVQKKEIDHLTQQLSVLWKKYDNLCSADGLLHTIKNYQASCPRDEIKNNLARQWGVIGMIIALIGALKLWG